jgi:hypothetical protein
LVGDARRALVLLLAGPAVFLAAAPVWLYRRHRAAFQRFWKHRRALSRASRQLRLAFSSDAGRNAEVCRSMRRYLSDRLDVSCESSTPDEVHRLLVGHGAPQDMAERFRRTMQAHFDASFGAGSAPGHLEVEDVLSDVDKALNHAQRTRPPGDRKRP